MVRLAGPKELLMNMCSGEAAREDCETTLTR